MEPAGNLGVQTGGLKVLYPFPPNTVNAGLVLVKSIEVGRSLIDMESRNLQMDCQLRCIPHRQNDSKSFVLSPKRFNVSLKSTLIPLNKLTSSHACASVLQWH
ncbi:hypothetical protein AVEN_73342-1 [Araneus ventricosus]|uniref:Uncharacterized protein n=1 Tax=Araneus ventricosus TaxID=182803 RepID=A0A4Y2NMZ3_ARAVE|nr:hypothetical protein AVEN_73342-1 [Araneus ventricosus]